MTYATSPTPAVTLSGLTPVEGSLCAVAHVAAMALNLSEELGRDIAAIPFNELPARAVAAWQESNARPALRATAVAIVQFATLCYVSGMRLRQVAERINVWYCQARLQARATAAVQSELAPAVAAASVAAYYVFPAFSAAIAYLFSTSNAIAPRYWVLAARHTVSTSRSAYAPTAATLSRVLNTHLLGS